MSESDKIKKNSLFSLISITSRLFANFVVFMILARYYGPETFGQFTFAHTLAMTFLLFADFGFDILLTTEIAKSKKNAALIFQQIFSLKLIFTIISLFGMFLFTLVFDISNEARELAIVFSFFMVFTTLTNFLFALFKGFEKLNLESIISFTINIGLILFTVAAINFRINVIFVAVGFTISRMIGFILGIKFSMNLVPNIKFSLLFNDLKNIRGKVLVFGFHFLFSFLFFQIDTLLLALLKGDYYVGIYQSVFKLIMLPLVLPEIFINVLLPLLSRLNIENHKQWKKTGSIMSKILFIIIIPVSLILFIYAEEIIDIIYGLQNYHEAVNILKIFSLIVFVRFCLEPFALMLTTSNRQIVRMYVVITAAIVNLVLNIIFIPYYGLLGAAFVSLACNLFVGILYIIVNIKLFKEWFVNSKSVIILISSLILYYFIEDLLHINLWNGLFIIVAIYSCLAYFYFFSKEEKSLLLSYNFTSRKT